MNSQNYPTRLLHSQDTKSFFAASTLNVIIPILSNIAEHYGITKDEAYNEVTSDEAEFLCDYITGELRNVVFAQMNAHFYPHNDLAFFRSCL